jgi:hypothetical protein
MNTNAHTNDNTTNISSTHLKLLRHVESVKQRHRRMGHRSVKHLIQLKKHNKATAAHLSSQMLREYEYICPICLVSNKRRKTLPGSIKLESERKLRKWEEVSFDTSGPWSTKSSHINRYYTVFVDHKDGQKLTIPHA